MSPSLSLSLPVELLYNMGSLSSHSAELFKCHDPGCSAYPCFGQEHFSESTCSPQGLLMPSHSLLLFRFFQICNYCARKFHSHSKSFAFSVCELRDTFWSSLSKATHSAYSHFLTSDFKIFVPCPPFSFSPKGWDLGQNGSGYAQAFTIYFPYSYVNLLLLVCAFGQRIWYIQMMWTRK